MNIPDCPPPAADLAADLEPAAVAVFADQLHDMLCRPLIGIDVAIRDVRHRQVDLGRARFLLLGARAEGWNPVHRTVLPRRPRTAQP